MATERTESNLRGRFRDLATNAHLIKPSDDIFISEGLKSLKRIGWRRLLAQILPTPRKEIQNPSIIEDTLPNSVVTGSVLEPSTQTALIEQPVSALVEPSPAIESSHFEEQGAKFSDEEGAVLGLLVSNLNGTSFGISEDQVFEFRISDEVAEMANRLVWRLPYQYKNTVILSRQDYLRARSGAIQKAHDLLSLDDDQFMHFVINEENEDLKDLLIGLRINNTSRQNLTLFLDQVKTTPEDLAWEEDMNYVCQIWQDVEPSLTQEYLELKPIDYSVEGENLTIETLQTSEVEAEEIKRSTSPRIRKEKVRTAPRIFERQLAQLEKIKDQPLNAQALQPLKEYLRTKPRYQDVDVDEIEQVTGLPWVVCEAIIRVGRITPLTPPGVEALPLERIIEGRDNTNVRVAALQLCLDTCLRLFEINPSIENLRQLHGKIRYIYQLKLEEQYS